MRSAPPEGAIEAQHCRPGVVYTRVIPPGRRHRGPWPTQGRWRFVEVLEAGLGWRRSVVFRREPKGVELGCEVDELFLEVRDE